MILAMDTSTDWCSVAVYDPAGGVRAEQTWYAYRDQTAQLLDTVQDLLARARLPIGDIQSLAVALGPGSFTGLRIGLATAKGLAYARNLPLWGIPTLDILAYAHSAITAAPVCAVLGAGRGRLAWATYRTLHGRWQRTTEYRNSTIAELCSQIEQPTLFVGELDATAVAVIEEKLGRLASIAPAATSLRRAGYLAELAWQRAQHEDADDLATLQAIYLQMPTSGGPKRAPAPVAASPPEPEPEPAF
jgi:tRNA threonylcarbamoyladenosine biosynthesis protein TsaB